MAVVPLIATSMPKLSPAALPVSMACWLQVVPLRTKTYAAPCPLAREGAPMMATSPVPGTATEAPKPSPAAPPVAVSMACWVHAPPLSTKTYAAPFPEP